jgi:hypothetical protein
MRELARVLRLVKAAQAKCLHTNEDDVCVKYYTWRMDKAWLGKHTHRLYRALSFDEASVLVQARTEHCALNACLFRKKLADSPACKCGRGDETVLHVLLRCERYAEAPSAYIASRSAYSTAPHPAIPLSQEPAKTHWTRPPAAG